MSHYMLVHSRVTTIPIPGNLKFYCSLEINTELHLLTISSYSAVIDLYILRYIDIDSITSNKMSLNMYCLLPIVLIYCLLECDFSNCNYI